MEGQVFIGLSTLWEGTGLRGKNGV